jgi:electron transfer flavoprotein alpha subunit
VSFSDTDLKAVVVDREVSTASVADLTEAERIVSGGRAVKSKEQYDALIRPLAASIGATPGASRAAVDAGYAPHSHQVGQTGKVVNPALYFACGISGAIQHLAGMRTSRVIVAINKDPEAPIFQHATYGVIADIFDFCPVLTEELKSAVG